MDRRDYIMTQIEQLGKVLGKILADLMRLKSQGSGNQGIEIATQQLKSKLDLDVGKLISLNKSELRKYLIEKKLTAEHLNILSNYFKEVGELKIKEDSSAAKAHLTLSLELLDLAEHLSKTISFDSANIRAEIEGLL